METNNSHSTEKSLITPPIKDTKFKDTNELSNALDGILKSPPSKNQITDTHQIKRQKFKIDLKEELLPPEVVWSISRTKTEGEDILGTMGNFGVIIGKAKSKKSFLAGIAVGTALNNNHSFLNRFKSYLPSNRNEVLYIDTEQGKYHVQKAVKRIYKQINITTPTNLHAFHLRSLSPSERLQFIEDEIYSNDKIGFVVIDGAKDLVTSINDEGEATMITTKLLKWTEERNLFILTVLHQNKGDNNARGHIGTELINKAETVLSVTPFGHDKETTIVEPQFCRNRGPEIFAFKIDEDGLPFLVSVDDLPIKKPSKYINLTDLEDFKKYQLLNEVFSHEKEIKYTELCSQLTIATKKQLNEDFGDNKIKTLITDCKNRGWLIQREIRGNYTLGEYQNLSV